MPWRRFLLLPQAKNLLILLMALPFAWMLWALFQDALGANPAEALSRATGDWTLRFLGLVLAVTPLRHVTRTPELIRFRRSIGLATFFYACLHCQRLGETAFHLARHAGFCVHVATGIDIKSCGRALVRRQALAIPASTGLCLAGFCAAAFLLDASG